MADIMGACAAMDANINTWGSCIIQSWFMNSPELFGIFVYIIFGLILYKTGGRFPLPVIVGTNTLLSFALWLLLPVPFFTFLFAIGIMLAMGMVAMAFIGRFSGP